MRMPRSAGRLAALAAMMLATLAGPGRADVYRAIGFDSARIESYEAETPGLLRLFEDGGGQGILREGGGLPPVIAADPATGSAVLALATMPTPPGARADRVELIVANRLAFGRRWVVGLRIYLPQQPLAKGNWTLLLQCHQDGSGQPPPLSLNLDPDGSLVLVGRGDADSYRRLWSAPLPMGRWVDVGLDFRLGPEGQVRLALDGRIVAEAAMPLYWAGAPETCSLKTGIYRGASDLPLALQLDDVTLADSLDELPF